MAHSAPQEGPEPPPEGIYEVPFTVEPNYAGWRLDLYLCEKIRRLSRTRVQEVIRNDLVYERPLKPSSPVFPGMRFKLRRRSLPEPAGPTELPVLFEDEALLAVDKPAGMPMHPTARYFKGTLVARLRERNQPGEKADPAHRLDRETSGLVLCGKTPAATRALKLAFAAGRVKKEYLALAEGWPERPVGEPWLIDLPLREGGEQVRIRMVVDREAGKEARTEASLLRRFRTVEGDPISLICCRPFTGRQHQIRAHLGAQGLPLVGDKIYGSDPTRFLRFIEGALTEQDQLALRLPRHALHAVRASFAHPLTRKPMELEAPLAGDLQSFLEGLVPVEGERESDPAFAQPLRKGSLTVRMQRR